jgi:NlpB/DapX lipoprotein
VALYITLSTVLLLMAGSAAAQSDDRTRVFNAPVDRVWVVARSTLKGLGWGVDKEDRDVGWIRTDSRRLEGEDYGVYSKGAKHRLRVVIKAQDGSRTAVTVERRVWKEERILWMDKEEDLPTTDHTVERQFLDALGNSL